MPMQFSVALSSVALSTVLLLVATSSAAVLTSGPRESVRLDQHLAAESAPSADNYSSMEAISGKTLQLTYHASVTKDCNPAPLPTIRLIDRPRSGTFTVRRATLTAAQIANCQNLNIPVQAVFYTSRAGYVGEDHVAYEVINFEGQIEKFDIAITVKAPADEKLPTRPGG
jgi:hypothetical protein